MLKKIRVSYRKAFSGLPPSIWTLALATLINRSGTMVLPFVTLYLTQQKKWTVPEAGLALFFYGMGALVGSVGGGSLIDRFHPKVVLCASLALTGFAFLILERLDNQLLIFSLMFAIGAVAETFRPANTAVLSMLSTAIDRERSFSLTRMAVNLGVSIGPVVGGVLAGYSYKWLFWLDGTTSIVAAIMLGACLRDNNLMMIKQASVVGMSPWRDRPYFGFLGCVVLLSMVIFQIQSTYPLTLAKDYNFSKQAVGFVLAVNTIMIVLFEVLLSSKLKNKDKFRVIAWGSLLYCGGMALLPLGSSFLYVCATVVVWTVGDMSVTPFLQSVVAARADLALSARGKYLGLFYGCLAGAFMIGPLLGSWIFERYGSQWVWYSCGVVGVFLWIGFSLLGKRMVPARLHMPFGQLNE